MARHNLHSHFQHPVCLSMPWQGFAGKPSSTFSFIICSCPDQTLTSASSPSQSGDKVKSKGKGKGRKRKASAKSEEEFEEESTPEPMGQGQADVPAAMSDAAHPNGTPQSSPSDITSSNAYMLLYKRRAWQPQHGSPSEVMPMPDRYHIWL